MIAFEGARRIATGDLAEVAAKVKEVVDRGDHGPLLIFDDVTSELVEIDFRKPLQPAPRPPGRPKLGVVAREVTLLPRHWDWLNSQPGGASVALRKLVEQARRTNAAADRKRQARESAYRFMSAIAGNAPGFEEAIRALFTGKPERFEQMTEAWAPDVRDHARNLAAGAFE